MDTKLDSNDDLIRAQLEAGVVHAAVTLALRSYGGDVQRQLRKLLRAHPQLAQDAYLDFCEQLWKAMPEFRWQCPLRIWMLSLASTAARRAADRAYLRRELVSTPNDEHPLWQLEVPERAPTQRYRQTAVKDRARELRRQLPGPDQCLLDLRIHRALGWKEIAVALGEVPPDAAPAQLALAAKRLHARFDAVRGRLARLLEAEGLLQPT